MKSIPQRVELDPPESGSESLREQLACGVVAAYRRKLEWILHIPEFEPLFIKGLEILELPGPRKGIALRPAINALLLENKLALVRWAFSQYRHLFPSHYAERLSRDFGLDVFSSLDLDEHLTGSQWEVFQDEFLFALSREHRRYKQAQTELFYIHRDLVEHTVNRMVFDPAKRRDCVQEGSLALLHAIDKVDDGKTTLAAYARMWIRRMVKNHLMGERFPVHVPINLASKTLRDGTRGQAEPAATDGGDPRPEQERKTALFMEQLRQPGIPLDQVFEDGLPLAERLADEKAESPLLRTDRHDLTELISSLIFSLTDKQREVLELRFGLNGRGEEKTLAEISRKIGISHQQVSMREKRALQKLEVVLSPYIMEIRQGKA